MNDILSAVTTDEDLTNEFKNFLKLTYDEKERQIILTERKFLIACLKIFFELTYGIYFITSTHSVEIFKRTKVENFLITTISNNNFNMLLSDTIKTIIKYIKQPF